MVVNENNGLCGPGRLSVRNDTAAHCEFIFVDDGRRLLASTTAPAGALMNWSGGTALILRRDDSGAQAVVNPTLVVIAFR